MNGFWLTIKKGRHGSSMMDKSRTVELFAESFREIGILFFVFAPLDALTSRGLPLGAVIVVVVLALFMVVGGIILQSRKPG